MRRSDRRQKRNAMEQDWCWRRWRRALGLNERPGVGKSLKRAMARRRRRAKMES